MKSGAAGIGKARQCVRLHVLPRAGHRVGGQGPTGRILRRPGWPLAVDRYTARIFSVDRYRWNRAQISKWEVSRDGSALVHVKPTTMKPVVYIGFLSWPLPIQASGRLGFANSPECQRTLGGTVV